MVGQLQQAVAKSYKLDLLYAELTELISVGCYDLKMSNNVWTVACRFGTSSLCEEKLR